jgi:tetratricopeptide (TPR) repeat protein
VVVDILKNRGSNVLRDPRRKNQNRSTALDTCLISIFGCLSEFQKRLLQFVSNFPAGCMEGDFGTWSKVDNYLENVSELERFFLIETQLDILGITRIYLNNPIRFFVRSYWKNTAYEEAAKIQLEAAESMMIYLAVVNEKYYGNPESVDDLIYGLYRVTLEMPNYIHTLRFAQWCIKNSDEKGGDPDKYLQVIVGIALGLGKYFFLRDMYKLGEEFLQEGIDACERLEEYEHGVLLCQYLLTLLGKQNNSEKEAIVTEQLGSFAEKSSDETTQARLAMSLGDLARTHQNFTEATTQYLKAANYFQTDADKYLCGEEVYDAEFYTGTYGLILSQLGFIYENQREFENAIKYYNEALKYQLFIRDYTNLGVTYHQLGNCYFDLQEYSLALTNYQSAVKNFTETQQGQYLGNALDGLGNIAEQTRQYARISSLLGMGSNWFIFALNRVKGDILPSLNENDFGKAADWGISVALFRKFLNIIKLMSFTESYVDELLDWCNSFFQDVLHISTNEDNWEWLYTPPSYYHRWLFLVALMGFRIAIYQSSSKITEDQLFEFCDLCMGIDEQFDPDVPMHAAPRSFRWLEEWLKYWDLYDEILTAEDLLENFETRVFNERAEFQNDEEDE